MSMILDDTRVLLLSRVLGHLSNSTNVRQLLPATVARRARTSHTGSSHSDSRRVRYPQALELEQKRHDAGRSTQRPRYARTMVRTSFARRTDATLTLARIAR
jgi:hypothetical protein